MRISLAPPARGRGYRAVGRSGGTRPGVCPTAIAGFRTDARPDFGENVLPNLIANLIHSPFPELGADAGLIYGQRFLADNRQGDLTRLHTHVEYGF